MPIPQPWSGLTPADRAIIDSGIEMQILSDPGPIDDFPSIDADGTIPFQFPPRLTVDGKEANWEEQNLQAWEPQALYMGANARKIVLETQYVVTSKGGNGWNTNNIADVLRLYKSYFYMTAGLVDPTNMPLIRLKIYEYANDANIKWRAKGVSITPEGALINDGDKILSLIHKVSMNLELVTQINVGDDNPINDMAVLPPKPLKEWY